MGESARSVCRIALRFRLVLLLLTPIPALGFDLGSLLQSFLGRGETRECPSQCNCTTQRAEKIMQGYVTRYLPSMGVHMRPDFETNARRKISFATAWLGNMADIRCHLSTGERANITDLLEASSLSFKSLRVTCDPGASVVWDMSSLNAFTNILEVKDCRLEKASNDSEALEVPVNLWVLHLERVLAEDLENIDLNSALQLQALSLTHTDMRQLPQHWERAFLPKLLFLGLAHNDLKQFVCEVKSGPIASLNLDHNNLTALPSCLLNGNKYASHVSLRHNNIHSLMQIYVNKSEHWTPPAPSVCYLDVSHNWLSSLRTLRKIEPLLGLDVSSNRLVSLAKGTFSLNKLVTWLDLSKNRLERVPDGALVDLPMMKHLNLSHNHLRAFDFDQSPLSSQMLTLDLRHNHLTYPPFADTGYVAPRLSRIVTANNPFMCDCNMHVFLQFLGTVNKSRRNSFSLGYWDSYSGDKNVIQPYLDTSELKCSHPTHMHGTPLSTLSFKNACPLLHGCPSGCTCQLVKLGDKHLSVNCSETESLTELPPNLPLVPDTPVVLYVNHTGLKRLEYRPYLHQVSELHAGYSKLMTVTAGAIQALQNVSILELHNNKLRSLPSITQNLSMPAATNISLAGNPWTCGCYELWMSEWLAKHADSLYNPEAVRCRWTGKMVSELSSSDLSCGVFNYVPLVIALSLLLGLAIIVASLLVKYKLEVLVFLYTRFRVRPFDMYKYDQARVYLFDVFVSFSQHDYRWVVEKLVDQLENRARPYRLCIHLRDFPVGAPIADSVTWAVENSRCTLLVLTRDFLASEWYRHEFRAAHARLLKDPNAKLLIAVHGPLDARILDRELMAYLRTHTYLRTEDKWFWSKIEYALPQPQETVFMTRDNETGARPNGPQAIGMDDFLPAHPRTLEAGDVQAKNNANAPPAVPVVL